MVLPSGCSLLSLRRLANLVMMQHLTFFSPFMTCSAVSENLRLHNMDVNGICSL